MFTLAFQIPLIAVLVISGKIAGLCFCSQAGYSVVTGVFSGWVLMHTEQSVKPEGKLGSMTGKAGHHAV